MACLLLLAPVPAAAQLLQPVVTPSNGIDFLSRYDFQLSAAALVIDDPKLVEALDQSWRDDLAESRQVER